MARVISQTFGVAGAILEKNGKILLVKEAKSGSDSGKWNHPAGWIELGEHPLEAVSREVKEETGYEFSPTHILGIYSLAREDRKKNPDDYFPHPLKIIFVGDLRGNEMQNLAGDVSEIKWFLPEEIYKMDKSILRDLDIKEMVKEYFQGKRYPLALLHHTVSK